MPRICHTTHLAVEVVWRLGEGEQEPNDADARKVDIAVPKDTEQGSPNATLESLLVGRSCSYFPRVPPNESGHLSPGCSGGDDPSTQEYSVWYAFCRMLTQYKPASH